MGRGGAEESSVVEQRRRPNEMMNSRCIVFCGSRLGEMNFTACLQRVYQSNIVYC